MRGRRNSIVFQSLINRFEALFCTGKPLSGDAGLECGAATGVACDPMKTVGYVRVSTDRQADQGVSLEAQEAKIRAMATVQSAELLEVIVDGGESAKSLTRPGLQRLLALIHAGKVQAVIVAKLDRLTRSVKDLCGLLELFEKRKVALISVAELLDTGSAAGRLVITIMGAVSQWEREAIGERTARRPAPQAQPWAASGQHRVRLTARAG